MLLHHKISLVIDIVKVHISPIDMRRLNNDKLE
jgi:hypothetical protein